MFVDCVFSNQGKDRDFNSGLNSTITGRYISFQLSVDSNQAITLLLVLLGDTSKCVVYRIGNSYSR